MFSAPGWCITLNNFCASWHNSQKYLILKALDRCRFMVLFTMPTAVVLSTCIGVGGRGWPSSSNINQMTVASWELRNSAPNSASAANAAMSFKMEQVVKIFPFNLMGSSACFQGKNIYQLCCVLLLLLDMRYHSVCLNHVQSLISNLCPGVSCHMI